GLLVWSWFWYGQYVKTERGRYNVDRLKLTLPLAGTLNCKILVARMCNAWGALFGSGYQILGSIDVLDEFCNNLYFRELVMVPLRKALERGAGLTVGCGDVPSHLLSPLAVSLIAVGEETGQLEEMMWKLSRYYQEEVTHQMEAFLTLIEPLMVFALGLMVGLVVLAVFLPLYSVVMHMGN
ncbi:MAG TPA: type II secretion system F family protein, partial [Candidatus Xenobia bacterium]